VFLFLNLWIIYWVKDGFKSVLIIKNDNIGDLMKEVISLYSFCMVCMVWVYFFNKLK
jgi:hypothetical protein